MFCQIDVGHDVWEIKGMHNFSHFVFHHLIWCHHHLSSVRPVELYRRSTCVSCSSWFRTHNDLCIQNPRVSECSIARVTSAWPDGWVRSPIQCLWVPSGPVRPAAETAERSGRADAGSLASSLGLSWTSISETEPELDALYMRLIRLSEINDQQKLGRVHVCEGNEAFIKPTANELEDQSKTHAGAWR